MRKGKVINIETNHLIIKKLKHLETNIFKIPTNASSHNITLNTQVKYRIRNTCYKKYGNTKYTLLTISDDEKLLWEHDYNISSVLNSSLDSEYQLSLGGNEIFKFLDFREKS